MSEASDDAVLRTRVNKLTLGHFHEYYSPTRNYSELLIFLYLSI